MNLVATQKSGRGLPQSKTLRQIVEVFAVAPASWAAAVLCRFFDGYEIQEPNPVSFTVEGFSELVKNSFQT